jgi:hypothetical protein
MNEPAQKNAPVILFPGQHEDERVLYHFKPHWSRSVMVFLALMGVAFITVCIIYYRTAASPWFWKHPELGFSQIYSYFGIAAAIAFVAFILDYLLSRHSQVFITERRLVRIDQPFPLWVRRRSLFWREVAKTKAYCRFPVLRLFKVGSIEVRARFSAHESITLRFVYYFEDLTNYIDKIVDIYNAKPETLNTVRPFVPKPAGKRYK